MNDFRFELEPFENEAQRGKRGTVGPFGDVMVFHLKPVQQHKPGAMLRTQLIGEHLPETYVDGIGMGGRPSLTKAAIEVAGVQGALRYNQFGLRRAARALHITYTDRTYVYATTKRMGAELNRPGVRVTFETGEFVPGIGFHRRGAAMGTVDEVDLAIAIVFEAVDTAPLSLGSAITSAPLRSSMNAGDGGAV